MAVGDLLVGAVSMPLSISLDALLLRKDLSLTICDIAFANQLVMYAAVCSSLYHLTVISWERYVALTKWMEYTRVMHTSRTKMLGVKAWFLTVLTTVPAHIMKAAGVHYKYIEIINTIFSLPAVVCMALIAYYYVRVYFGMRKTTLIEMSINARKRARRETGMTMSLTLSLLICYIPSIIVLLFGKAAPFLRTSSFFRWSELLVHPSSLLNPFLYYFALNRRFRQEILSMFNIRKREIQPEPSFEPSFGRRSARTDGDEGDTKNTSKSEERQQREHTPETLQPCEDIFLKPYRPLRMQKQTSPPAPNEVSRVTRVPDMHQTIPAKERSKMEQNLPNNNNNNIEVVTREPMPSSLGQVSRVTRVDVYQTKPAKARSQMEQNLPNNNTEFETREPMPSSPGQVSRVIRVEVHQPKPAKEKPLGQDTGVNTED